MEENWNQTLEKEFKEIIKSYFDKKIEECLDKSKNVIEVGDTLGHLLKSSEEDIVKIITPRAVKKWASKDTLPLWEKFLQNEKMVLELREIGKSIANSLRPLAGNSFAMWITKVLNRTFENEDLDLLAVTSGEIKQKLNKMFDKINIEGKLSFKPDIDIIIVNKNKDNMPIAILSAKTTLAERVLQTISWNNYIKELPKKFKNIKLFLVTAWEKFESGINRERVQQLDGIYVCNTEFTEYGKIKKFSKIIEDLKELV